MRKLNFTAAVLLWAIPLLAYADTEKSCTLDYSHTASADITGNLILHHSTITQLTLKGNLEAIDSQIDNIDAQGNLEVTNSHMTNITLSAPGEIWLRGNTTAGDITFKKGHGVIHQAKTAKITGTVLGAKTVALN